MRPVPNSHGAGAAVSLEMGKFPLLKRPLALDAVHDLNVIAVTFAHRVDPAPKSTRFIMVTECDKGVGCEKRNS